MEYLSPEALVRYSEIIAMVIAVCAAVASVTPTKVDDRVVGKLGKIYNLVSRVVNIGGLNVAKAKNKDD